MKVLTRVELKETLKEIGVVTRQDLKEFATKKELLKTEKRLKREMNKGNKKILAAIANVATNSPTIRQFDSLERRVTKIEASI